MTAVENAIDHDYLRQLVETREIAFGTWIKGEAPHFYLNSTSGKNKVITLFGLTETHFKGEPISLTEFNRIIEEGLVPTKLWISQGQVYTNSKASSLSEADKQAVIASFIEWVAPKDFSVSFRRIPLNGVAVAAERDLILDLFRTECGLEGFPDSYIIKMLTSLTPTSGR